MARRRSASLALTMTLALVLSTLQEARSIEISLSEVTEVLKFGREVVTDVLESYQLIKPKLPGKDAGTDFPFVKMMEKRLMSRIGLVSAKIDAFEGRIEHRNELLLDSLLNKLPEREQLEKSLHDLWKYLGQVDNAYQSFVRYAENFNGYDPYTMEEFARNAVSSNLNALPDVLKMIHRLVVPPKSRDDLFHSRSVLTLLSRGMQVKIRHDLAIDVIPIHS